MTNLYPINLKIENQLCLVVGGGPVAERKVGSLLACGARIRLVSPEITPQLEAWAEQGQLDLSRRPYEPADLSEVQLVFVATNHESLNRDIAEACGTRGLWVNVADAPEQSNFFVPSVIRRGKLNIAVSTSGASPLLAARIRRQLEHQFGPEYQEFLELLTEAREQVLSQVADIEQRKKIFKDLVESDLLELLRAKQYDQVKERVRDAYCGNRR